jgi:hypothetical protein
MWRTLSVHTPADWPASRSCTRSCRSKRTSRSQLTHGISDNPAIFHRAFRYDGNRTEYSGCDSDGNCSEQTRTERIGLHHRRSIDHNTPFSSVWWFFHTVHIEAACSAAPSFWASLVVAVFLLSYVLVSPPNRDRGKPHGSSPPTPPYIRVTNTAVR